VTWLLGLWGTGGDISALEWCRLVGCMVYGLGSVGEVGELWGARADLLMSSPASMGTKRCSWPMAVHGLASR
jgi:hypothetical protein